MAGQRNNYGKRSHSHGDYSDNGGNKRRNPGDDKESYAPGAEDTVYRYLCPGRKIGSIIGRGGEIVKQLRADTQAKIRIGETVLGCEERVISIFSSGRETNSFEDSDVCPAQEALFKVHERLVSEEAMDEDNDEGAAQVTARLLVPSDQIGCIIGKGGQIIQGIRSDTGAQIRILKNDHLPACAISSDELLQITGEASVVKKALFQVSSRLHDNPSRSNHLLTSNVPSAHPSGGQYAGLAAAPPIMSVGPLMSSHGGGYKSDFASDWPPFYAGPRDEASAKEFSLRMLCPAVNIGGVIGRGGGIIKQIRQESGAYIKVDSSSPEDACIITISAKEFFEDPISQTIDAAVRLQPRCSEKEEKESGEATYTTRLLVPTSRIGCLIGKGGSIISEMRKTTHANIRILAKEQLPKVAAEDDEMVQIIGNIDVARTALIQVTTRLKANCFEREGLLSAPPAPVPYPPILSDDRPKYSSRDSYDSKSHSRGYSSYSGGYGSADALPSEPYGGYGGSHGGGSSYGSYGGYSGRSGSAGLRSMKPGDSP
ncbi:RNA-binding KH domain-containing protein RCF3-like isoform X2 [Asparagus officinalis]|uniref:RNA-binding KH domain-containing protein RCF3-like isoform X2 n=1 Tax=Asparagus officinalis TaxID=4686 RepID=UPI00098E70ED|nr:RNA-binding KH domain-containing protein RCF3-like isoform X2 [Asparagus officinalis]